MFPLIDRNLNSLCDNIHKIFKMSPYKIPTKNLMPHVFNKTDILLVHHIPLIVGYRHFLKELKNILSFIWPKRETVYIAKILTNELYSFYTG